MGPNSAKSTAEVHRRFRKRMMVHCVDLMEWLPLLDGRRRPETLEKIRETTHQLAGSAGAFGFDRISSLALSAEDAAKDAMSSPEADTAPVVDAVRRLCAEVAGTDAR